MPKKELLLQRLDEIGSSLARKGEALLLLALGSVGIETDRLDEHSDLDFFVIVRAGQKQKYVDNLDWLEEVHPLAYSFKNTSDGYKIMFEDGIYGEYAVFEEWELDNIPYSEGRIVWNDPSFTNLGIVSNAEKLSSQRKESLDHSLNEALTNLYVGLGRYARGEKLSGARFVQGHAVDRILSVLHLLEQEVNYFPDPFGQERRLEKRYPTFASTLGNMILGYEQVPESALNILSYLEKVYPVNRRLSTEIRRLANQCRNSFEGRNKNDFL